MIRDIERVKSEPLCDDIYLRHEADDNNIPHPRLLKLASVLPSTATVLDVGAGFGRASMPFALRGMEVTALDEVNAYYEDLESMGEDGVIYHSIKDACPTASDIGEYDVVLVNDVLFHAKSSEAALALLDWSIDRLKPGGFLWANYIVEGSVGHHLDLEDSYRYNSYLRRVSATHFVGECACSGIVRSEDVIFVPPLLYPLWAAKSGLDIVDAKLSGATGDEYWGSSMGRKEFSETKDKCFLLLQKPLSDQ